MDVLMKFETTAMGKGLITHITYVRTLSIMEMLMKFQTTAMGKGHITHTTYVRTLSSMYTFVCCQVTLTTETFTTQITEIWIVIIMSEHMSFQSLHVTE